MSDQPPPAGHPPERAPQLARVPGLSRRLRAVLAARKRRTAGRFAAPTAWLRLALLGLMLICLSALAPVLFEGTPGAFDTGILAFYCGVLACMIIIRLGWPECYLDWMACGLFYMAFGGVQAGHARLAALRAFRHAVPRMRVPANLDHPVLAPGQRPGSGCRAPRQCSHRRFLRGLAHCQPARRCARCTVRNSGGGFDDLRRCRDRLRALDAE